MTTVPVVVDEDATFAVKEAAPATVVEASVEAPLTTRVLDRVVAAATLSAFATVTALTTQQKQRINTSANKENEFTGTCVYESYTTGDD
jgi:hypothetical protein